MKELNKKLKKETNHETCVLFKITHEPSFHGFLNWSKHCPGYKDQVQRPN